MDDEFDIDVSKPTEDEETGGAPQTAEEPSADPGATAVAARKPGLIGRLAANTNQFFSRISLPEWNLRTFLYLLVALIIAVLLARNWPPVRIDLFGWRFDAPKSVVFIVSLILGAGLLRLWQICAARRPGQKQAEEEPSVGNQI